MLAALWVFSVLSPDIVPGPISPAFQADLLSLLAIIGAVLAILMGFRRKPPLDTELVKLQLSIESLQAAVSDLTASQKFCGTHRAETAELMRRIDELEGKRDPDLQRERAHTEGMINTIFLKIDDLKDSISANFQSMEGRIGKVEGTIGMVRDALNLRSPK